MRTNNIVEINKIEKWSIKIAIGVGIIGLLVLILATLLFTHKEVFSADQKIDSDKFGDYGSFLSGAVGTLWSLIGVILFYLTLRMQRNELSLQREELELTRNELAGQKNQMIKQNETLKQQQFENTFFQLLNTHSNIVNSLDLRKVSDKSSVISEGRDCFEIFYQRLEAYIKTKEIDPKTANLKNTLEGYDIFFEKNQNNLGHYFRNLYHILKFVDNSKIKKKNTYTNFIRAQLSSYELTSIFYNCIANYGSEKFKPLIEKYALLKNMNPELVFNQDHLNEFKNNAYGADN